MFLEDTVEGSRQAKGTNGAMHVHVVNAADHIDPANGVARVEQGQFDLQEVAAGQTDEVLGDTGGAGDFLHKVVFVPASTSPGAVKLKDGSGSDRTLFAGGSSSLTNLQSWEIELNVTSKDGAWKITTGSNISVLAAGRFTE